MLIDAPLRRQFRLPKQLADLAAYPQLTLLLYRTASKRLGQLPDRVALL